MTKKIDTVNKRVNNLEITMHDIAANIDEIRALRSNTSIHDFTEPSPEEKNMAFNDILDRLRFSFEELNTIRNNLSLLETLGHNLPKNCIRSFLVLLILGTNITGKEADR